MALVKYSEPLFLFAHHLPEWTAHKIPVLDPWESQNQQILQQDLECVTNDQTPPILRHHHQMFGPAGHVMQDGRPQQLEQTSMLRARVKVEEWCGTNYAHAHVLDFMHVVQVCWSWLELWAEQCAI